MPKLKRFLTVAVVASMLTACGAPLDHNGKHYPTVGIVNMATEKSDKMCYEASIGNIIWSIILIETIVAPIYFIGWSMWNPVGPKGPAGCGIDSK